MGFKEFCGALDSETKGMGLSNSDQIRSVHNSFARQTLFEFDSKKAEKDDDVFHFVSYVPINGRIYELDGLKAGPVDHGPAGDDWTDNVRSVIEARMMKYTQGEIQFNLMAVIQDKTIRYNTQLKSISGMSIDSQMAEVARIEMLLAEEENKRSKWKQEISDGDTTTSPSSWRCSDHLPAGENCCLSIIRRKKRQWRLKRRRKTRKQPLKFDVF